MANENSIEPLFTRKEAAERLRISPRTLDDLKAMRTISFIKVGRKVLIRESEIQRFLQENTVAATF